MMSLGMNVNLDGAEKFLSICKDAGIREIRLNCNGVCSIEPVLSVIRDSGMKAYVVPFCFESDWDRGAIETLPMSYRDLSASIPKDICVGIALPENSRLVSRSNVGLKRVLAKALEDVTSEIRLRGHMAVLPMGLFDLALGAKHDVDAYDVNLTISECNASSAINNLKKANKPVWLGRVTRAGGSFLPAHRDNLIVKLKEIAKAAKIDRAYLWSDKGYQGYHWSNDGVFQNMGGF